MCLSSSDPGGPRRFSGDARRLYDRACTAVQHLERAELAVLDDADDVYGVAVSPLRIDLPEGAEQALEIARRAGGNPLIVGGAVRDAAHGRHSSSGVRDLRRGARRRGDVKRAQASNSSACFVLNCLSTC